MGAFGEVQDTAQGAGGMGWQEPEDIMSMVHEIKALMKDTKELEEIREIKKLKKVTEEKRKIERSAVRKERDDLRAQLSLIASQSARGVSDWRTPTEHLAEMERLNTDKFALAKANAELQSAIEKLEQAKREEEDRIEAIDAVDISEGMDVDGDAITLKILRSVGFVPLYADSDKASSTGTGGAAPGSAAPGLLPGAAPFEELTAISKKRQSSILFNVSPEYLKQQDLSPIALADQLWKAVA